MKGEVLSAVQEVVRAESRQRHSLRIRIRIFRSKRRDSERPGGGPVARANANRPLHVDEQGVWMDRSTRCEFEGVPYGVSETCKLDLHSPYGCSRLPPISIFMAVMASADCDRSSSEFHAPVDATVRAEDQGRAANFALTACVRVITVSGDGKLVRDLYYVYDLWIGASRVSYWKDCGKKSKSEPHEFYQRLGDSSGLQQSNPLTGTVTTPRSTLTARATKMIEVSGNSSPIALLGRRDRPTDALRDYCDWLAVALNRRDVQLQITEFSWEKQGFLAALAELRRESKRWRGRWVLVQYTALGWSRRGFPLGFLTVLRALRRSGARCGVVFHDAVPYGGGRLIDQIRRACQLWVMRRAYQWTEKSFLTIPLDQVPWLPPQPTKAVFIPISANLPPVAIDGPRSHLAPNTRTVAVFGITGEPSTRAEVHDIGYALKRAKSKLGVLRLVVVGRGSREAEPALRRELDDSGVEISVLGLLPNNDIAKTLANADVLLFVRGGVSSRRGSALAGIACGLPIVGYAGPETGFPITEAGLELAPMGDRERLAVALDHVLGDDRLRQDLHRRSLRAHADYFSWDKIAERFATEMSDG